LLLCITRTHPGRSVRGDCIEKMKETILITIATFLALHPVKSQTEDIMTDRIIKKSKIVNCSLDAAWWKWTTHEGLVTFFGADNKVELKPGGAYEIYIIADAAIGEKGGEGNMILSYLPKEMISFTWNAPPDQPEIRIHPHKTWVVLVFDSTNNNQTKVTLSHLGWLEGEKWEAAYKYFDSVWPVVLTWMADSCE